ncbi:MAG TPA: phosphoribosylglycinamide formyltransferase [Acidimicrobiia bacterium]|nr:phosphoribosylglycinamide formyltransferase [Acidimicrobiia bacterium]
MLVSGSGTNLQALIDGADDRAGYEISVVISDRPGVRALDRARDVGIPTAVVAWTGDRRTFTHAVCEAAVGADAAALVLAGFMRILGAEALRRFPDRILNIHPSLLPAFPGSTPVADTLAHGVRVTGVTVHLIDERVDHGPIVSQEAIAIDAADTEFTLHQRLHEVEHRLYPEAVSALARGRLKVEGRRVVWS